MSPSNAFEKPEDKRYLDMELIESLCLQIRKIPALTTQTQLIDVALLNDLQIVQNTVSLIIDQFQAQKNSILQSFDHWILPIAQQILDGLLEDAQQLKKKLEGKLMQANQIPSDEWEMEVKCWMQLYSRWNDRQGLMNRILEVIADRTAYLIEKDIQVIQDYQTQSLSQVVHKETNVFKNIEKRLAQAIEEPLNQLMGLRNKAKEQNSLQQASEWVANLQEQRESYFDQLLMKIDHVMKDVIELESVKNWNTHIEMEEEIIFMERDLHCIEEDLQHVHLIKEDDKQFLLARLESLLGHVIGLDYPALPSGLQMRMQALQSGIVTAISHL